MPHCKNYQKVGLFLNQKSIFILIEMPGRSEFHFSNWSFGGYSCPLAIFNSFVTFFLRKFFWRWKSNVHEWICGGALLSVTLRHNERSKTFPYMGIASPAFLSPSAAVALHYMMPIYGDFESIEAADNEVTFQRTNIYVWSSYGEMNIWKSYIAHISLGTWAGNEVTFERANILWEEEEEPRMPSVWSSQWEGSCFLVRGQ